MRKFIGKFLAAGLCIAMALSSVTVKADSVDQKYLALGADLTASQKKKVLELLDLDDNSDYKVITVTNKDEHEYLDSYLSNSVIGTRALSSVTVEQKDDGNGVNVTTQNISYCTSGMYRNALITAGIKNADVKVAGPFKISGTAALVGVMKAYEEMTGKKIPEKSKDAATDELITTGEVAENIGSDDAEKLIADVKQKVAKDNLSSPSEIKQAIEESAKDLNINLSDADRAKIQSLMDKISGLDLNVSQLKSQAKDLYDKLGGSQGIFDKIVAFFQSIFSWLSNLFS